LVLSVPGAGFYSISCECEGRIRLLADLGRRAGFSVNSHRLFIPNVPVVQMKS
jgi:hypothetical protein